MDQRTIYQDKDYRIIEVRQNCIDRVDIENAKGDTFHPEYNPLGIALEDLKSRELDFECMIDALGLFGYELQKWSPEVDEGWEHVDSCWGFIGEYDPTQPLRNHYIIDELKSLIPKTAKVL